MDLKKLIKLQNAIIRAHQKINDVQSDNNLQTKEIKDEFKKEFNGLNKTLEQLNEELSSFTKKEDLNKHSEELERLKTTLNEVNKSIDDKISKIQLKHGKDGVNGIDGKDGINGRDGKDGKNGKDGKDGANGLSAYEIAVKQGYEGTEEEWIEHITNNGGKDYSGQIAAMNQRVNKVSRTIKTDGTGNKYLSDDGTYKEVSGSGEVPEDVLTKTSIAQTIEECEQCAGELVPAAGLLATTYNSIPRTVSQLENDSGFITDDEYAGAYYGPEEPSDPNITIWIDSSVSSEEQELNNYAKKSELPTKLSQLENDKNFVDKEYVDNHIPEIDLSDMPKARKLDTPLREMSATDWAKPKNGQIGTSDGWSNVSNAKEFKKGDIAFLDGRDTTNDCPVKLIGEVNFVSGNTVNMTVIDFITYLDKADTSYSAYSKKPQSGNAVREAIDSNKTDTYSATSSLAMTGIAVAQALETRNVKYYKFRDTTVNFELKKGRMYMFSASGDAKAYIQCNTNSGVKTVSGIDGKTMDNFKNGFILMADRCSCGGSTGDITNILTMLNMVKNDVWNYSDGSAQQYPPYYLKTTTADGIDIWEI